jgi:transposase
MMGIKERTFQPLPDDLFLEVLVPKDNFYRRLEERIDLSFVRELVFPLYAKGGRHSIDPVVFFKLQLVLFFENLRSERQLMEVVADRLSIRWYLGYDLHEPLPDHSSLTKIRERYGLEIFRNFFERIVEMCVEAGLVRGKELFFCSSTPPRWRPTPPCTPWPRGGSSKPICTTSSRKTTIITRVNTSLKVRRSLRTRSSSTACPR